MKILNRFTGAVIKEIDGADLRGTDLRDADLRGTDLCGANLYGADLRGTNLYGADLRDAKNLDKTSIFELAPKVENLHKRIADAVGNGEALDMGNWHKCATTHCRGGWAIFLAGDAGKIFEAFTSSDTAARLIYLKSTGMMPDFYADNKTALADIQKCAEGNC